ANWGGRSQHLILQLQHNELIRVHEIQLASKLRRLQIRVERNNGAAFLTRFGGNNDDTVGAPCAVDSRRSSVFQHVNTFDIGGVHGLQATHFKSVNNVERGIVLGNGTSAPYPDHDVRLRGT